MRTDRGRTRTLLVVALAVVAAVVVGGAAASDDTPTGREVLNDTRERYANAESVVGAAEVSVSNGTATETATVEFARAGNGSRVVVEREDVTYRWGTNGSVVWFAGPNRTGIWPTDALRERTAAAPGQQVPGQDTVLPGVSNNSYSHDENVTATVLRTGSDDGTEAYVVRVEPENESVDGQATLWVATTDSRLLRVKATDGTNTTVVDYRETTFNASVHESTFAPPADRDSDWRVQRFDDVEALQSETSMELPRADWEFQGGQLLERPDGVVATQRYDADGTNVTVVSTTADRSFSGERTEVSVADRPANVTEVRGATVVYWRSDGVTTAVVTRGSREQTVALADELRP